MRKGIDLATTLERIEKNFVITDPRLPDNPIVRLPFKTIGFILTMLYKFCDLNFHHRDEDARCKYVISLSVCISDICIWQLFGAYRVQSRRNIGKKLQVCLFINYKFPLESTLVPLKPECKLNFIWKWHFEKIGNLNLDIWNSMQWKWLLKMEIEKYRSWRIQLIPPCSFVRSFGKCISATS